GTPMSREDDGLRAGIAKFTDETVNERERPGLGADLAIARSRLVGLRGELLHVVGQSDQADGHGAGAKEHRPPRLAQTQAGTGMGDVRLTEMHQRVGKAL